VQVSFNRRQEFYYSISNCYQQYGLLNKYIPLEYKQSNNPKSNKFNYNIDAFHLSISPSYQDGIVRNKTIKERIRREK